MRVAVEHGRALGGGDAASCGRGSRAARRGSGSGTWSLKKKRSSCASGSGYVPSISSGFCVARTTNGSSSTCVRLPTLTRCSCIASSSALCVLGVARFISSASTMFAKTGPLRNSKDLRAALRLVDDRRAQDVGRHEVGRELDARERERRASRPACARASSCRGPGTPSSSACPPASMHVMTPSTTSRLPTIDLAISARRSSMRLRKARDLLSRTASVSLISLLAVLAAWSLTRRAGG